MKFTDLFREDYNYIVEQCMLDKEYADLLEYQIRGYKRPKMSKLLHVSESVLDVMTAKLKKKVKKLYKKDIK